MHLLPYTLAFSTFNLICFHYLLSLVTVSFFISVCQNSSGGWHPDEMFQANKEMGIGTSYRDNLEGYTYV